MGKGSQGSAEITLSTSDPILTQAIPLSILGIEVTQAIQHFRSHEHLSDSCHHAPDNSVPLVANKTTWVRVYVRSGPLENAAPITGVAGTITSQELPEVLTPVSPIIAYPDKSYHELRDSPSLTLNFVIPAQQVLGLINLHAEVTATGPTGQPYRATREVTINAQMHQTLKLAGIMIRYNGPNAQHTGDLNLSAPTIHDLQTTSAWTLKTRPISEPKYRIAGSITWGAPLTDSPNVGDISPADASWNGLVEAIIDAMLADGNQAGWIYYALLPSATPVDRPPFTVGLWAGPPPPAGSPPSAGAPIWQFSMGPADSNPFAVVSMSHEIGHQLKLAHAPCHVAAPDPDPNYPDYAPYDTGSIGEFGLDIDNGDVYDPNTFYANMSYCSPQWTSLYFYKKQQWHPMLHPKAVITNPLDNWGNWKDLHKYVPPWVPVEIDPSLPGAAGIDPGPRVQRNETPAAKVIAITGQIDISGQVTINGVARVTARPVVDRAADTGLTAQLLNTTGEVISQAVVYALNGSDHGGWRCECGGATGKGGGRQTQIFLAFLPNLARGDCLCIVDQDHKVRWRRTRPETRLKVEITSAAIKGDRLAISWSTRVDRGADSKIWVQYSADRGKTWSGMATGLTGRRATLSLASVPPGQTRFQVLVHDGFSTAQAHTAAIRVPPRRPSVAILHPQAGQRVPANRTIRLHGHVDTTPLGRDVDPGSVAWLIDDKEVARGLEVCVTAPEPGEHTCTLVVKGPRLGVRSRSKFFCLSTDDQPQGPVRD